MTNLLFFSRKVLCLFALLSVTCSIEATAAVVGTVRAWGDNESGQLGNGVDGPAIVNMEVQVLNLSGVTEIAGGGLHSLALKSDGTVWSWGQNVLGQLGNGTTLQSDVPIPVNNLSLITAIVGGDAHSVALKSDGTVWAWGGNPVGQLGNGTDLPHV